MRRMSNQLRVTSGCCLFTADELTTSFSYLSKAHWRPSMLSVQKTLSLFFCNSQKSKSVKQTRSLIFLSDTISKMIFSIWIRGFYKKKVRCWQKLPWCWSCYKTKCFDHQYFAQLEDFFCLGGFCGCGWLNSGQSTAGLIFSQQKQRVPREFIGSKTNAEILHHSGNWFSWADAAMMRFGRPQCRRVT